MSSMQWFMHSFFYSLIYSCINWFIYQLINSSISFLYFMIFHRFSIINSFIHSYHSFHQQLCPTYVHVFPVHVTITSWSSSVCTIIVYTLSLLLLPGKWQQRWQLSFLSFSARTHEWTAQKGHIWPNRIETSGLTCCIWPTLPKSQTRLHHTIMNQVTTCHVWPTSMPQAPQV